jgi:hypothetical protein
MSRNYKEITLKKPYQVTENYILQRRISELEQINNERELKRRLSETHATGVVMGVLMTVVCFILARMI